ncbi:MAG: GFA family protein, partial [Gammaproteobacteria bacterium]|nr:GFA family protein [Gammaproteobacteria bacterium]
MAGGGCLCGRVRFEAAGEPKWVAHCHCRSCRHHTGSPVATFVGFTRTKVVFAAPNRSVFSSSPGVWRSFCNQCGTPIAYEAESAKGEIHLYVCTFDDPAQFVPERHVFYTDRLPW